MKQFACIILVFLSFIGFSQNNEYKVHTIAFYNLENLFDTVRDTTIYDESFTPTGSYGWNDLKYQNKLVNMSSIIAEIGTNNIIKNPPTVIGVCEVENKKVLEDLVASPLLSEFNYGIIHFDSKDERGIDTALLYRKEFVTILEANAFETIMPDVTDKTRDILHVKAEIDNEPLHFLVNHWPSRSGGEKRSMPNRVAAAKHLKELIANIQSENEDAKIIAMGDFNDDPVSPSIKKTLKAKFKKNKLKRTDLYNPYYDDYKKGFGTTAWRDAWSLFDMQIVSTSLLNDENGFKFLSASRYAPQKLLQTSGRFKGYPKRTHAFGNYLNGYSDHLPVYIYIAKQSN